MMDSRLRWTINLAAVALAFGLGALALLARDGLPGSYLLNAKLRGIQDEIHHLERDNALLAREVRRMRESRRALERQAAEELLMAREGSVIYRFNGDPEEREVADVGPTRDPGA